MLKQVVHSLAAPVNPVLIAAFLLGLFFDPEGGGDKFLQPSAGFTKLHGADSRLRSLL
jgi:hypothetical protein